MDTKPICPVCLKILAPDTPLGLCPECLIRAGFNTGTEPHSADEKKPRFIPPTITELAKHFPQLEILELIGQGGMGAVYKARQKQLDRAVALKILPPQVASGPGFAERFTREVRALAKLNHPHIVTLYEFGQTDGLFYFLMEFVDGVNLRQLLNHSRIAPKEALSIVPQICDALQYAHDRGIVHRDIKPENIILSKDGQVKIADFGVAKIVGQDSDEAGTKASKELGELTETGSVLGTPQYMAPEQVSSPGEVDHRADIYALGVVFYQMLTGELPTGKLEPPSRKVQIDVRLDEIVLRALEKKPELRYQQASELKTQVETMVASPSKSSSPEEEKSKLMNKKTAVAIAVVALLLTAVGYASWPSIAKTDQKEPAVSGSAQTKPENQTTVAATNENNYRLNIELRDGSHIVGKSLDDILRFRSASLGDMKLAVSGIRSIAMADDGVTARLEATNGDALDVQFIAAGLRVETGFGKTELPVKLIKSIRVSAMSNPGQMPSGLVALWSGEGNANDSVGGNNGQLVGSVGFMPGKVGQAFNFNNEIGSVNFPRVNFGNDLQDFRINRGSGYGYVQIPASPALDVGKGDGFTFECWIKPVSVTQRMLFAEYERAIGTYDWADIGFNFGIRPPSVLAFNLVDDTATHSGHDIITPPNLLAANVWQHIALTYDKASGIAVIYINGAVAVQSNLGSFTPQTSFPYLLIGARTTFGSPSNLQDVFSGGMDEIGIYNHALSADEIQTIYNSGNPTISVPPPANPPKPNISTRATITNEAGFRLTIELRDGSHVVGKSLDDTLRFHSSSLGDMKFSVEGIRAVVMADDGVTARLTATNGDELDVQFVTPALRVETGFGKTELPVKLIKSIRVAAMGKSGQMPSGLVSWWPAEGNANDIVGSNNGILQGDTTFAPGEVGQAFSLNASASSSVRIPYAPSLITPAYTVETWINPTAQVSGGIGQTVIFGQPYGQAQLLVRTGTTGVLVAFQFGINHFTFYNVQSTNEIPIGQFTHIAGTWDGTTLRLYINGVLNAQNTPEATPVDSGCDFFIGGFNTPEAGSCQYVGQFFNGIIDEVSLYNRALSAGEIASIYNSADSIISVPPPANPPKPNLPTPVTTTNETGFRLTIDLRDGSRVAGKSLEDTLRFHSASLGDMKLAVAGIRSIVMAEDGATAKVTTTSGDVLDVQFITQALPVETVFGKTELPVKMIRSIKISSLGKPGYLPPGLVGAWLDNGNGYDSRNGRAAVIEVPNSPALASMQQTHQLSFAAWIKPTSFPCEFPCLLVKGSTTQHDATFGGYVFTLNANGDNDLQFLSGALQIVTHNANGRWINHHMGEWIHVAFTLNAITRTAKFYVNGKPTDDEFIFGTWDGLNLDVPSKLFVGSGDPANGPNPIFEGQMQDMFLFNRALSADEIQTIYNAEQPSGASFPP
jgi:serine/threonine protein kinase